MSIAEAKPKDGAETIEPIEIMELMKLLPHRYPFLLVDRIVAVRGDEYGCGIKNVSINEPHFQGHFPQRPIMPGVLMIEGMAQTAGAIVVHASMRDKAPLVYFMSIDKAHFRKPVEPGDRLEYHVTKLRGRGAVWKYSCEARIDGERVAEAVLTAMVADA